jgi:hypothetical protein
LFSQEGKIVYDSLAIKKKSSVTDTIIKNRNPSPNAVDKQITHTAHGYRKTDMVNKKEYLVGDAKVTYGDIILKADSIVLNMNTGLVFAIGRKDSTGKIVGSPVFQEGSETFQSKELTYNFKSKEGIIKNIITEQEGGFLHSALTKKMEDGTLNISTSQYTTCDAEHPHYAINFNKAKVIPGKKIISGPAYLVLEGIPLPIVLPFGYFPITKDRSSGIIIPRYGEERQRGYFLSNGGYYFIVSDYFDLALTGNLYANGTWLLNAVSNYRRLYKYSGSFSLSYASNINGHEGLPDYSKSTNYRIGWNHNQDAKARPGSRFSASVDMSSSGYDKSNSYVVSEHVNTQRQSSISYSKTWEGTPFNLSTSLNHSQNVKNKTVFLNLPKINFNMGRIYPFKSKYSIGKPKWYQEIQLQYSASVDNQINTYDSLLFTNKVWKNMKNGFRHEIPISFQLRPFNNFSISPQLMYSGVLYTQKIGRRWIFNPDYNKVIPTVITDTIMGLFYGQSVNPSISAGFNPQLFGTFMLKKPGSRLQAVRHVIRPSVGFSYIPVLKGLTSDMYKKVQVDTSRRLMEYSIFEGNLFGTPSLSKRSGSLTFSLVNTVEAKVFPKNDTTGKAKKIKIIDNFGINTSYDIFADSLRWSPVTMNYRTTLLGNFNIAANSNFSLYALNKTGQTINTFYYTKTKKLLRITNFSTSVDFDLGELVKGIKSGKKKQTTYTGSAISENSSNVQAINDGTRSGTSGNLPLDKYGYAPFNVPWSLRVAYSLSYVKTLSAPVITQTLALSGSVTLTKKMNISYSTGYDITRKEITMTSLSISRDLHCWDMHLQWIPTGYMKSWQFTIKVKASILGDLKYDRRKDFHDQY